MKICGIICEYNPFHLGHFYQMEETRRHGMDGIICVMSGNFVQRAEPALLRKHARAEAAVRSGADLVLELPTPWAISSAETFADGAIHLLSALPDLTHFSFGCESGAMEPLTRITNMLDTEEFSSLLKQELAKGHAFATARARALEQLLPGAEVILKEPNNILAIEYLKANQRRGNALIPLAIQRQGGQHDSESPVDDLASARAIRTRLSEDGLDNVRRYLPPASLLLLEREITSGCAPVQNACLDIAILSCLKKMQADDFLPYADVSEGLHIRLKEAIDQARTRAEAVALAKTKRYAHARIRRIFLNAFLGITAEFTREPPPYLRVLAFNDRGRKLLAQYKKSAGLPIITKPTEVKNLSTREQRIFSLEVTATELYNLAFPVPQPGMQEWTTSPIYCENT